jgi:hypothetical protein
VDEQASADRSGLYEDDSVEWKGVVPEFVDDLVLLSRRYSTQVCEPCSTLGNLLPPPRMRCITLS